ncbi:hypothetical protein B566_EDAN007432 [Ephemera danica]|nr:hypothetical protein B566_EDAN007432 [Ephemera danica]
MTAFTAVESKISAKKLLNTLDRTMEEEILQNRPELTISPVITPSSTSHSAATGTDVYSAMRAQTASMSKYAQLLAVIEEMGKDIRPTYAGSKSSAERLKRGIVHSRILVRECLMETERSARQ